MLPLSVEVGYSEESEVYIGDPTQSLLRVHTDECLCATHASNTEPPSTFLEPLNDSNLDDFNELPPTMCTDRLPGTYCPFGDPSECDCLELFTSHVGSSEDPAYIEELLDELSSSLSEISDVDMYDYDFTTASGDGQSDASDNSSMTMGIRSQLSQSLQLTSTPVHQRNPVLTSVVSPVFDENSLTETKELHVSGQIRDQTQCRGEFVQNKAASVSGKNSVFRNCKLDDSLELFGMAKLVGDDMNDAEGKGVYGETWWELEGPYIYNRDCDLSQLVLPDSHRVDDSTTLFF